MKCEIEKLPSSGLSKAQQLRGGHLEPTHEVIAPDGYQFENEGTHTRMAHSLKEAREIAAWPLVRCPPDCDCGEGGE